MTAYEPRSSSRRFGIGLRGEPCGGVRVGDLASSCPSYGGVLLRGGAWPVGRSGVPGSRRVVGYR